MYILRKYKLNELMVAEKIERQWFYKKIHLFQSFIRAGKKRNLDALNQIEVQW